jgi:hypothetical protein
MCPRLRQASANDNAHLIGHEPRSFNVNAARGTPIWTEPPVPVSIHCTVATGLQPPGSLLLIPTVLFMLDAFLLETGWRFSMRYLAAWLLGVPLGVIVLWYVVGHAACGG